MDQGGAMTLLRRMKGVGSMFKKWCRRHWRKIGIGTVLFLGWFFCLPRPLFTAPVSTVVTSAEEVLLGARIAGDGQWRFPKMDSVPYRFEQSIVLFEDEYFYQHPGFNPVAIVKAIRHNLTHETRRGGSTLTQQLIRLSRQNKRRTYLEKGIELVMATRLEFRHSKAEILKLYATYTPFGGNVVGLETASWRYFGIPAHELSWGQSATLAVLPNAPSLIFPGKNQDLLRAKRNRLLKKLLSKEVIDTITYELALEEPLPGKPLPLPDLAPHLVERIRSEHGGEWVKTSVDASLQRRLNHLAELHAERLKSNDIQNLAILVIEVATRKVIGYVGNSPLGKEHGSAVDVITKKRSTGSTLKPFLFASLLHEGELLPNTLVKDIPTVINSYQPKNFNKKYSGALPASRALSRSLNVPAVRLLRQFGLQKFHNKLHQMNINTIDKPANHYGLSLILGGAESSLWDVTKTYAAMAATLNHFTENSSTYRSKEFTEPTYLLNDSVNFGEAQFSPPVFHAGAIYHTVKALREVNRPEGEADWEFFDSSQPIAWKTGTSFGFKDAWAVGVTPKYAIGVWAGNADGEGRPGITGITAAAPLLFDVLELLPQSGWFQEPFDDFVKLNVCKTTGFLASPLCTETTTERHLQSGLKSQACPYHKTVFLDASRTYQVNSACYPIGDMVSENRFVLPTRIAYYYADTAADYSDLPPYMEGCSPVDASPMEFIYPKSDEEVLIPKELGGTSKTIVLKLAHDQPQSTVYWYLDDTFVGETSHLHELLLSVMPDSYMLTAVDGAGNRLQQPLHVRMASEN